jgi:hypothetical protein
MDILLFLLSVLGYLWVAAIFLLKAATICVPAFLACRICQQVFESEPDVSRPMLLVVGSAVFFGGYIYIMDSRFTLASIFDDEGPWHLSFVEFWLQAVNPLKYPFTYLVGRVSDERFNQALIVGVAGLLLFFALTHLARRTNWRTRGLALLSTFAIIYATYQAAMSFSWILHYSWPAFVCLLLLPIVLAALAGNTITLRPGDSVSIRMED